MKEIYVQLTIFCIAMQACSHNLSSGQVININA